MTLMLPWTLIDLIFTVVAISLPRDLNKLTHALGPTP